MFGNLGLHVHQFPSKRWGYVGTVPTCLASMVPATTSDVMGQRAFKDDSGALVAWKFPTFDTERDARDFAAARGCMVQL